MMNWNGNGYGWMNGGGFFFMVLVVVVIVGFGVWLATRNTRGK